MKPLIDTMKREDFEQLPVYHPVNSGEGIYRIDLTGRQTSSGSRVQVYYRNGHRATTFTPVRLS